MNKAKVLQFTAWLTIGLHLLGLLVAVLWIRPGTPVFPVEDRMGFVANGSAWQWSWGVWLAAAFSFVAFLAALLDYHDARGTLVTLAISVGVAAASIDTVGDIAQIVVIPRLASPASQPAFMFAAGTASIIGIIVANGLYPIAVVLATLALGQRVSKTVHWLAWLGMITAWALSAVGFLSSPHLPEYFAGPAIGAYILWVFAASKAKAP